MIIIPSRLFSEYLPLRIYLQEIKSYVLNMKNNIPWPFKLTKYTPLAYVSEVSKEVGNLGWGGGGISREREGKMLKHEK